MMMKVIKYFISFVLLCNAHNAIFAATINDTAKHYFWMIPSVFIGIVITIIIVIILHKLRRKNLSQILKIFDCDDYLQALKANKINLFKWTEGCDYVEIILSDDNLAQNLYPSTMPISRLGDLVPHNYYNAIKTELMCLLRAQNLQKTFEFQISQNDIISWISVSARVTNTNQQGMASKIVGVFSEISDEKMEYLNSIQALKQYQDIFDASNIGFWKWDIDAETLDVNAAFILMLGYHKNDKKYFESPLLFEDLIHPDDLNVLKVAIEQHLSGHTPVFFNEFRIRHFNGNYIWIQSKGIALKNTGTDKATTIIGINIDINENKINQLKILEHEKQLSELARGLEENMEKMQSANRLKDSFLANMSHEIRTPLNAVIGMTDVLGETALNENQRYYVSIISHAGDNLLSLINDILDMSKIEAGKLKIDSRPFSIRDVAIRAVELVAFKFKNKDIVFSYEIMDDVPLTIIGDEFRVYQVLVNLLNNAGKFTADGEVSLKVHCSITDCSHLLNFEIIDTGIGIPANSIDAIFNVFGQINNDSLPKVDGTGLGLSISKQLAIMMGGDITVESKEGEGSVFGFTIAHKSSVKYETDKDVANILKQKIVILNDHKIENSILVNHYKYYDCEVLFYDNFTSIDFDFVDIVFLDWYFFKKNRMTTAIKKLRSKYQNKIIMLLPIFSENNQLNELHNIGIRNFVHRPLNIMKINREIINKYRKPNNYLKQSDLHRIKSKFKSILIVDDSVANLELMKVYVKDLCHDFLCVENGRLAIDAIKKKSYDIIFMDIQMPVMDGYQTTSNIRKYEQRSNLRPSIIIALTAYALKDEIEIILNSGFDDYLSKPLKKELLLKTLTKYRQILKLD